MLKLWVFPRKRTQTDKTYLKCMACCLYKTAYQMRKCSNICILSIGVLLRDCTAANIALVGYTGVRLGFSLFPVAWLYWPWKWRIPHKLVLYNQARIDSCLLPPNGELKRVIILTAGQFQLSVIYGDLRNTRHTLEKRRDSKHIESQSQQIQAERAILTADWSRWDRLVNEPQYSEWIWPQQSCDQYRSRWIKQTTS